MSRTWTVKYGPVTFRNSRSPSGGESEDISRVFADMAIVRESFFSQKSVIMSDAKRGMIIGVRLAKESVLRTGHLVTVWSITMSRVMTAYSWKGCFLQSRTVGNSWSWSSMIDEYWRRYLLKTQNYLAVYNPRDEHLSLEPRIRQTIQRELHGASIHDRVTIRKSLVSQRNAMKQWQWCRDHQNTSSGLINHHLYYFRPLDVYSSDGHRQKHFMLTVWFLLVVLKGKITVKYYHFLHTMQTLFPVPRRQRPCSHVWSSGVWLSLCWFPWRIKSAVGLLLHAHHLYSRLGVNYVKLRSRQWWVVTLLNAPLPPGSSRNIIH